MELGTFYVIKDTISFEGGEKGDGIISMIRCTVISQTEMCVHVHAP